MRSCLGFFASILLIFLVPTFISASAFGWTTQASTPGVNPQDPDPTCPYGWRETGNDTRARCIRLFQDRETWWGAESFCRRRFGGHLVSVIDDEEARTVVFETSDRPTGVQAKFQLESEQTDWRMIGRRTWRPPATSTRRWGRAEEEEVWVGMGDWCPTHSPSFSWSDGTVDMSFQPWTKASAPHTKESNCVSLKTGQAGEKATWSEIKCSELKGFVCERLPLYPKPDMRLATYEDDKPPVSLEQCGEIDWCFNNNTLACYKTFPEVYFWERGLKKCQQQEADLVSIHSKAESIYLTQLGARRFNMVTDVWIGLNRLNPTRDYTWTDRTAMDYLSTIDTVDNNFGTGESIRREQVFEDRSCMAVTLGYTSPTPKEVARNGMWKAARCDKRYPLVCKRYSERRPPPTVRPAISHKGNCAQGWEKYEDKCYRFYLKENERKKANDAKATCSKSSAKLASISDVYEQGFVMSHLKNESVDAYIGLGVINGELQWADDATAVRYTHFSSATRLLRIGESTHILPSPSRVAPSLLSSQNVCVYMSGTDLPGYWETMMHSATASAQFASLHNATDSPACDDTLLGFVCEKYVQTENSPQPQKDTRCDDKEGWFHYHDNCYFINDKSLMNWTEAETHCNKIGFRDRSHLVSVEDIYEWNHLFARLYEAKITTDTWIGLKEKVSGEDLEWSDEGVAVHLSPWGPQQPSLDVQHRCVATQTDNPRAGAQWYMRECNRRLPFICKTTDTKITAPAPATEGYCGKGWLKGHSQCYRVEDDTSSSGYEAHMRCFRQDNVSGLASIPSKEDMTQIMNFLKNSIKKHLYFFIGLVQKRDGGYYWMDGKPMSFVSWAPGEPEYLEHSSIDVCVQMDTKGLWHDVACWHHRPFICSKPFQPKKPAEPVSPPASETTTTAATTTTLPNAPPPPAKKGTPTPETTGKSKGPETTTVQAPPSKSKDEAKASPKAEAKKGEKISGGMSGSSIAGIVFSVLLISILVGCLYLMVRAGKIRLPWRSKEPGFVQFDTLQDEVDEFS